MLEYSHSETKHIGDLKRLVNQNRELLRSGRSILSRIDECIRPDGRFAAEMGTDEFAVSFDNLSVSSPPAQD